MKYLISIVFVLSLEGTSLANADVPLDAHTFFQVADVKPKLELRLEVVRFRYCDASDISVLLKLTYKNTGSRNVIVSKYSYIINSWNVFENMKKFTANKPKGSPGKMHFNFVYDDPKVDDFPDPHLYAIIKPGEEFTLPMGSNMPVASLDDGSEDCDDDSCLKPGKYLLQVNVFTWVYSSDFVKPISEKWKSYGDFFAGGLRSQPLEFTVDPPNKRTIVSCNLPS